MAERRFTRGLGRVGLAAQLREDVSQAVRATATQARPRLADPIDFEEYVNKNKVVLSNDPLRELVMYPADDISYTIVNRETRTLHSLASVLLEKEVSNPLVKQCLTTYSQPLTTITYKYLPYSGSYLQLPRLPKVDDLKEQVYEIDTDIEQRDLAILSNGENILKRGYLLKAPEGGNEKIFGNFSAKTFKRRFACLRQEVDGTYLLEFHKDERKNDSKGALVMDFCTQINKNPRRGKCCFELTFSEGGKSVLLSAESEADLEDWMDKLTRVIHADKPQDDHRSERGITPPSSNYGTLRGLEHSLNPQLIKYAHETDFSIAQARKEDRHQLFNCYSSLPRHEGENGSIEYRDESDIYPFEEKFGVRIRITCKSIKFKLQAPIDSADGLLGQIEPYFTSLALYDTINGCKISEDFHFDLNNSFSRGLLQKNKKKEEKFRDFKDHLSSVPIPLQLAGVPEEWLAYPKQSTMSVQNPHSEIYLVLKIEKVLQGSINQSVEPYIKNPDPKSLQKLQKNIKTCCQRLGEYRMPFGWCARSVFKSNGEIDSVAEFSPIYKSEEKKISDTEMLKLLNDFKKPEKMNKLTVIPGSVSVEVSSSHQTLPNSVTSALEPVKPFPNPPTHEPTFEVQEFLRSKVDFIHPYISFCNHLYLYPKFLNYENQKSFSRARNLVCMVELRDSDMEGSQPLKVIHSSPGLSGVFISTSYTAVLHHNTFPEWNDEIKIALPHNLTPSHHLLFTFAHIAIEGAKAGKKEDPIETVGYSWLPLINKGRICTEEQVLPVAAHLPFKYLSVEPLGLGKGFSGPEIRWVDGQKNMFKVQMRLVSTILSNDQHLTNFFNTSASLIPSDNTSISSNISLPKMVLTNDVEMALFALDIKNIIEFLPTILNQLFLVMLSGGIDVPINVTRVLVHITHEIYEAGREDIIYSYIKYVQNITSQGKKTVHEELCQSLAQLLQSSNVDPLTSNKILKHLQFFFSFVSRSMTIHLLTTARIKVNSKMVRNERFSEDFQLAVKSLVELVSTNIIQKYKEMPVETRAANKALAHFLKQCLGMMNRGYVFGLIKLYLECFSPGDPITLHSFKFTVMRIVCSHEHFIPLNLPVFNTPNSIDPKKAKLRHSIDEFHLSPEFNSHHFLVGALLSEVRSALGEVGEVQRLSISVLRDLLAKHAFDDRYLQSAQQGRVSTLYFPVISVLMENVSRLSWPYHAKGSSYAPSLRKGNDARSSTRTKTSSIYGRAGGSLDLSGTPTPSLRSSIRGEVGRSDSSYLAIIAGPGAHGIPYVSQQPLSPPLVHGRSNTSLESEDRPPSVANSDLQEEEDDLDDTASSISKSHSRNLSVAFTGESGTVRYDKLGSSEVKDLLMCFLHVLKHVSEVHLVTWWLTLTKESLTNFFTLLTSHDGEGWVKALQEANLATEVGLIVLDVLCNFTTHCGDLVKGEGCEEILQQVFSLHLLFLQLGQSESLMKHVFAALRAFINNFPSALFQGIVICKLTNMRHEACAVLYLLMRSNYEFTRRTGINRVHLQVIISVSQLLGEVIGLNNSRFQESMALINSYASSDKAMTNTGKNSDIFVRFVSEVRDLTKRIRTVLVATAQMREHERDPEMLCDLQHSLAASYAATPELRTTWLQAMAKHHVKNGDMSEAAFCQLHIAALMAEYLKHQGEYPEGCKVFEIVSPNIPIDESNLRLDADLVGIFINVSLSLQLTKMSQCNAYSRAVEVNASQKRLLGRYFRVAFYGATYFEEEAGKAYVYKEPKVTSLAEISERLYHQYCEKFGKESVKMIMDSNFVDADELDSRYAYIQVTHVHPYFPEEERPNRQTEFEKNHNINSFVFETPFTLEGKAHGKLEDQWKRRVLVTTAYSFPYVKKRILITSTEVNEMSPIEVAIDEMESRVKELKEIINKKPTDVKKLQLKLQGSISVQVNAGPLAYASTFLEELRSVSYPVNQVARLKDVYREFMMTSKQALDLNGSLISNDQYEYQMALETNFTELLNSLSTIFNEPLLLAQVQVDSLLKRSSQHYLSMISSPGGASIA
ncbi:Dedicator of cytokinesis protein 9 [Armadillidium nasatum]|uniref:Dedicator of cytokinesis protein 9 n=1 Tax=Armadillidium nasatum TaxID=96803 RepID=A0A5N5TGG9_9CRUS|nr:Dedicator of cytokinesis protein 9 [Armadillidium nasatum]